VIEIRVQPRNGVVASGAGRNRKHGGCRRMLGVCRLLPGRQVASGISAVRGRDLQLVVPPNVTAFAGNIGVPVGEREIDGRSRMVDIGSGAQPAVKRMTRLASLGELRRYVIGIGSFLKIRLVTGNTSSRESLELADGRALVAILALHRSMRAQEWKAILVIFYLLDGIVPALNGVALRTVGAHLPLVNVNVTILAVLPYVSKHGLDVALRALHFFVHAAQRILGFVVIELRNSANGAPTRGSVAVFARNIQGAMRTSSGLPLGQSCRRSCRLPSKEQEPAQNLKKRERKCPLIRKLPSICRFRLGRRRESLD